VARSSRDKWAAVAISSGSAVTPTLPPEDQRDPRRGWRTDHVSSTRRGDGDTVRSMRSFTVPGWHFSPRIAITKDPSRRKRSLSIPSPRTIARLPVSSRTTPCIRAGIASRSTFRTTGARVRARPFVSDEPSTRRSRTKTARPRTSRSKAELAGSSRAVDALGPKHRLVVVLHYLNGLNLTEIAQVVDCRSDGEIALALRASPLDASCAHPELGIERPARSWLLIRAPKPITARVTSRAMRLLRADANLDQAAVPVGVDLLGASERIALRPTLGHVRNA